MTTSLEFYDYVAEEGVVVGDAVVEVEADFGFGHDLEAFVVFVAFGKVGTEAVEALAFFGGEVGLSDFESLSLSA